MIPGGERVPSILSAENESACACRAYRASFLPLHWLAASNWRRKKRKERKQAKARAGKRGHEERMKWTRRGEVNGEKGERESGVCHANKLLLDRNVERPRWACPTA